MDQANGHEEYPTWCEERATSLALVADPATEPIEVEHVCKHTEEHDGAHECMWCNQRWDMEVPC